MQFVNNDMDDMLRKAAEHYPLDTSGADWNKIALALQNGEQEVKVVKKNSNRGRFLWLLLLLPLGLVCNRYFGTGWDNSPIEPVVAKQSEVNERPAVPIPATGKQAPEKPANGLEQQHQAVLKNERKMPDDDYRNGKDQNSFYNNRVPVTDISNATANKKTHTIGANTEAQIKISTGAGVVIASERPTEPNPGSAMSSSNGTAISSETSRPAKYFAENFRKHAGMDGIMAGNQKEIRNTLLQNFDSTIEANRKQPGKVKDYKFYAGIMGGIDATTIKFQKVENLGFDYGALAGYRFNEKWSIEAGAFISKKLYYTDGEYFNSKGIYLPPNTKISEVSGKCIMWDVPISVRYNFKSNERRELFSTIGLSSYFMKKEAYEYVYYYNSSGTSSTHYRSYKNSSQNLFSALQLTAGYTYKIANIGSLRIEPYLRIPVADMGVGKLPLMSTGIHIGLTRKLY